MADTRDEQDATETAPSEQKAQTYTMPEHGRTSRESYRQEWLEQRSHLLRDLLALVPIADQSEAMALILRVEQAQTRCDDTLTYSWRHEVQLAYSTGRAEQATEELQRMTGEPETATAATPERTH